MRTRGKVVYALARDKVHRYPRYSFYILHEKYSSVLDLSDFDLDFFTRKFKFLFFKLKNIYFQKRPLNAFVMLESVSGFLFYIFHNKEKYCREEIYYSRFRQKAFLHKLLIWNISRDFSKLWIIYGENIDSSSLIFIKLIFKCIKPNKICIIARFITIILN